MSLDDDCRIIIDNSRVTLQIVASLTDDSRGVIHNCNMLIVQATEWKRLTITNTLAYHKSETKRYSKKLCF